MHTSLGTGSRGALHNSFLGPDAAAPRAFGFCNAQPEGFWMGHVALSILLSLSCLEQELQSLLPSETVNRAAGVTLRDDVFLLLRNAHMDGTSFLELAEEDLSRLGLALGDVNLSNGSWPNMFKQQQVQARASSAATSALCTWLCIPLLVGSRIVPTALGNGTWSPVAPSRCWSSLSRGCARGLPLSSVKRHFRWVCPCGYSPCEKLEVS
jgi:hypothetical protein